jgi:uncharacterized protein (TIGR02444 family)
MTPTDTDLWSFSLRVYRRAGVERSCLDMQARWNVDVNLVLYCCWFACSGRGVMDAEHVQRLIDATRDWQLTAVQPLRALRHRIKKLVATHDGGQQWYEQLLKTELQAERLEQRMLESYTTAKVRCEWDVADERLANARGNLLQYLHELGVTDTDVAASVDRLMLAMRC